MCFFFAEGSYYMFMESSGALLNSSARFISPVYPANYSSGYCLKFAFYMQVGLGKWGLKHLILILIFFLQGIDMGELVIGQGPDKLEVNFS